MIVTWPGRDHNDGCLLARWLRRLPDLPTTSSPPSLKKNNSAPSAWSSTPSSCGTPATSTEPSTASSTRVARSRATTSPASHRSSMTTSICTADTSSPSTGPPPGPSPSAQLRLTEQLSIVVDELLCSGCDGPRFGGVRLCLGRTPFLQFAVDEGGAGPDERDEFGGSFLCQRAWAASNSL